MPVDPFGPLVREHPYAVYAKLREGNPVHRSATGAWLITRYEDVRLLLGDPRMSHWGTEGMGGYFSQVLARWVALMDPRNGSALREGVLRLFSARALEGHRRRIEERVARILDRAERRGEIEIMHDFAEPLTLDVIAAILGVPEEDRDHFIDLARDLRGGLLALMVGPVGPSAEVVAFSDYLTDLVGRVGTPPHGAEPGSLLEAMAAARSAGDELRDDDPLRFALIFLFAGHDNMMNFIGNAALALAENPASWERLATDPSVTRTATEELIRFGGPVHFVHLRVTEPLSLGGKQFTEGDAVLAGVAAANRDPSVFGRPDELDLDRRPNPHLGFGTGALYCIGASLARMQGHVVLPALTGRFECPDLPDDPVEWRSSPEVLRGPRALPFGLVSRGSSSVLGVHAR